MSTALVTGGGTRLGRVFCNALASKGYNIAIHYNSSATEAAEVKKQIEALGVACDLFAMDFSQSTDFSGLIERVSNQFPDLNLLVNSASLYHQQSIQETSQQVFSSQMQVNLMAPYFLTQAFAKQLQTKGLPGNVINVIDNKVAFNQYHYSAYLLTKKALAEFTKMAALELAPSIRVNGISPGVILPMESRTDEYLNWRIEGIPLAKQGRVDDLTHALNYILDGSFITGQILTVDGGESITNSGRNAGGFSANE